MSNRFELYRLSLLPSRVGNLFEPGPDKISREEWLRKVFNEEQPFEHYGSSFHYVPSKLNADSESIVGRVGRLVYREENKPPAEGLEAFTHEAWLAAVMVLDPSHHEDGQKLAIQNVNEVGSPKMLVKSLVSAINERYSRYPYAIEVGQIIDDQSFWGFVENNKGNVTSLTLDFIVPNMFGSQAEIEKDLQEFRDSEEVRKVRLNLANEDGIKPDTKKIRDAVTYAAKSGGRIRARAKGKKTYRSDDTVKRTYIEDVKETGLELIEVARKLANRILGR